MAIDNAKDQLAAIMDEYGDAVYRLALSRCGSADTASDVYQQTFLLLLEKKPRFADRTQLKRWLLSAARKLTAMSTRRAESKNLPLDSVEPAAEDRTDFELYELISSLPETLREPTLFFYIEDMSVKEIAQTLGISEGSVKTLTCDNGKEFSGWEAIEAALGCQVYFADPFCAWQKGTNENTNGLIRQWFPKGSNLRRWSQAYIDGKLVLLNNRPRKCLKWQTPAEAFSLELSRLLH